MKHSLFDILIQTGVFFQDAIPEKESLKIPALIVSVLGIVSALYAYLIGGVTGKMMAGLLSGMESIIAISSVLGAIIGSSYSGRYGLEFSTWCLHYSRVLGHLKEHLNSLATVIFLRFSERF